MPTIRDILLAAISDMSNESFSNAVLAQILIDQLKANEKRIKQLQDCSAAEKEQLHADRERMREEYRRMKSDPLYGNTGIFYFADPPDETIIVTISGSKIQVCRRKNNIDYLLQQISVE